MQKLTPRPGIMDAPVYVPGEHKVQGHENPAVLSANENPYGPSPKAIEAYSAAAGNLHRYPDGGSRKLRDSIAKIHDIDASRVTCGAGSDEIITFLTRCYAGPGDEVLYSQYGFLMYPIAALTVGATPVTAPETDLRTDINAVLDKINDNTKIIFIANPNNPTGSYLTRDEIVTLADNVPPSCLLVIDAAYAEFVDDEDYSSGLDLVDRYDNLVMTRTFSKAYGLASLRIGWCYASAEVTDVLNRVRGPFNLSAASQAAGLAAMEDQDYIKRTVADNNRWRDYLTGSLRQSGIEVPPSVGNFILAGFGDVEKADAAYTHLESVGIIARKMGGYGLPSYIRISIGTEDEVKRTADALNAFMS